MFNRNRTLLLLFSIVALFILNLAASGVISMLSSSSSSSASVVYTPYGPAPSSCVFEVANDSTVFTNRTVVSPDGQRRVLPACTSSLASPGSAKLPATNSWVEDANWCYCPQVPPAIGYYSGQWKVPGNPSSNDGQVIYLFNGLENGYLTNPIIQPVLQWGNNGLYGGNYWTFASWAYLSGSDYAYSPPQGALVGDLMIGLMQAQSGSCNSSGSCNWNIATEDADGTITTLNCDGQYPQACGLVAMYYAYVTLEVYNVVRCSDYPSSSTTFSYLSLKDQNGYGLTPSWAPNVLQNDGCGENVVVNSASSASLYY
jgi:hypothetical protein